MNVGILGCGHIARKMADTINRMDGFTLYAVASRSIEKAIGFQKEFHALKAYGSYNELVKDKEVDLVYIATPHSLHREQMILCLENEKPVLCEKIFTTSSTDTRDIYQKFEEKGVFVSEAFWTSFMPSRGQIGELLTSGIIGDVTGMEASYEYPLMAKERVRLKSLGGGVAMDIGVYPVSFILRTLGFSYDSLNVVAMDRMNEVDSKEIVEFSYGNIRAVAIVDGTFKGSAGVIIRGTKGTLSVDSVNNPKVITVTGTDGKELKKIECAAPLGGFEYELAASKKAIESHKTECEEWTHENSIALSEIIDRIIY